MFLVGNMQEAMTASKVKRLHCPLGSIAGAMDSWLPCILQRWRGIGFEPRRLAAAILLRIVGGKHRYTAKNLHAPRHGLSGERFKAAESEAAAAQVLRRARSQWNRLDASEEPRYVI